MLEYEEIKSIDTQLTYTKDHTKLRQQSVAGMNAAHRA